MPCSHLIDLNDLPVSEWSHIIDLAIKIKEHPGVYAHACEGRRLASAAQCLHPPFVPWGGGLALISSCWPASSSVPWTECPCACECSWG